MPVSRKGKYLDKAWVAPNRTATNKSADWVAETREKLRKSAAKLLPRVVGCAMGEVEMTAVQLKAAELVMRKILPDLVSAEMEVNDKRPIHQWSNEELAQFLAVRAGEGGIGETIEGVAEPLGIH